MSQRVYIDQILKPVVKPWLDRGYDFCLEEDSNSGHGTSKNNIVRKCIRGTVDTSPYGL